MRRYWLILMVGLLATGLVVGAVACSKKKSSTANPTATESALETPGEYTTPTVASKTPSGVSTTPTAQAAAPITITLNAMGGSGVTGTATLTDMGTTTDVDVIIDGGLTPGIHMNHIHTGTCAAQGPILENLKDLTAGADGSVPATSTTIAKPLSNFDDGNHYVAAHATDGTVVACGDIPAM
jgi:hypothetical protein